MKKVLLIIVFFIAATFLLPLGVFLIMNFTDKPENNSAIQKNPDTISVFFTSEGKTHSMKLEEYLLGVVSAEMPASFESEALKAQAVAARSYAIYKSRTGKSDKTHPDAAVCTDHTHCKAYKTKDESYKDWGEDAQENYHKIESAVKATEGEILTYNGEVALTVFHSQTGGVKTENSSDVWGGSLPYLVSVESREKNVAADFYSSCDVPFEEFARKITAENPHAKITSPDDIGEIKKSEGGGVKEIIIGGESFSGQKIRSLFSLRSSCFSVTADKDNIHFEVTGYGHGVGMSQYGANTMALEGYSYKEILTHYYSGTVIDYV